MRVERLGLTGHDQTYRRKRRLLPGILSLACASVVAIGCISFGMASADVSAEDPNTFGITALSESVVLEPSADAPEAASDLGVAADVSADVQLDNSTVRDISKGIAEIEAEEEAARIAAEEAARAEEAKRIAAAEEAKAKQAEKVGAAEVEQQTSTVDFNVGKDAFISEWTARIDNYLAGSPLAGQGINFATAAWEYGVDPRWSPAISNTESGKGSVCFHPYNAWGWGQSSWSSWEEAIWAHVKGLSEVYGYTISYANAQKYCPPFADAWYRETLAQMNMI